jgi:signal transduction histidine kinase
MPERFRGQHVELRQLFLNHRASRMMGEGRELFGLRKENTEFPLEIDLNPIDLDGEPMVLASIVDVTARREADHERERQRRELERSNADLEEFAYVASHDLKAPLRAIGHLVQWIGEDIETVASPETRENLKLLRGRVTRLQMLLDGLLAYARVGRIHAPVEDVDIAETVNDIIAMLAPPPGLVVACEGEMGVLRTHRMPIRVVLENLISNGLKHHDRAEGRITVTMRKVDGGAEFRVSDDGPGIPPRFHDRIFVIFQTLASRDDIESSGIGLAIVKKKVQVHGGEIWLESAPPARGTSFVFTWKETVP